MWTFIQHEIVSFSSLPIRYNCFSISFSTIECFILLMFLSFNISSWVRCNVKVKQCMVGLSRLRISKNYYSSLEFARIVTHASLLWLMGNAQASETFQKCSYFSPRKLPLLYWIKYWGNILIRILLSRKDMYAIIY